MNPIVNTAWLAEHLTDGDLRIIDIRGHVAPPTDPHPHYFAHRAEYEQSHLPGAVFVDWVRDITDPASPNASQIATPEAYAAFMSSLGIGDDTLVVAYDDAGAMFAARLWWTLTYYGHDKVVILDGGWQKWTGEGRPVTTEIPQFPPATFTPHINPAIRRTIDEVAAAPSDTKLIDVRTPAEYTGEASRAQRSGHIPGAINLPRGVLVNADGTFPTPEALRARFAEIGLIDDAGDVVLYCNGGVSASYGLLALKLAGFENGAVYDGSWKEWGNDPTRPIE